MTARRLCPCCRVRLATARRDDCRACWLAWLGATLTRIRLTPNATAPADQETR